MMESSGGGSRRGFLGTLTVALGALAGAIPVVPGIAYVLGPIFRRAGGGTKANLGPIDDIPIGKPVRVPLVGTRVDGWTRYDGEAVGAAWIQRDEGGRVTCFSTTCPHLGCAVDYDEKARSFICPCHGSQFDGDGRRVSGPSPRNLDTLETVVEDGVLSVSYVAYRQGVAGKEPL